MNQTTMMLLENVSALADGQLEDEAFGRVMAQAAQSGEVQAAWQRYHLIGDVLRAGRHEPCVDSSAFVGRLQQRLALEPLMPAQLTVAVTPAQAQHRLEAANAPVFRWKMVAGLASVVAAMAVGWGWTGSASAPAGQQLAQIQSSQSSANSVVATSTSAAAVPSWATEMSTQGAATDPPQTMLRDARLDELLAAHHQATGGLQPSVFLRNATFEGPSR